MFLRLQGERSLEHENLKNSEQAYDKHLLSKFGSARSEVSTRNSSISSSRNFQPSAVGSPNQDTSSRIPSDHHPKHPSQLRPLSVPDGASKIDPPQHRWPSGAQSATVSPGQLSSASSSQSYVDFRSPTYHRNGTPSFLADHERYLQAREAKSTRSGRNPILSNHDDNSSLASRSNRGSYDQGFNDVDTDFPMDEAGLKHLNLGDRSPPHLEGLSPVSTLGQKRRASSPPREASREDRLSLSTSGVSSELFQRRASGHLSASRASPVHRFHPNQGSISSVSSLSARTNGSYTSSTPLSAASSSITSVSSFDRHSPGGASPSSEMDLSQDSPYVQSVSLNPSPRGSVSRASHQRTFSENKPTAAGRKMSSGEPGHVKHHSVPTLQGVYMCECCPKKPKKFDTQEELQ